MWNKIVHRAITSSLRTARRFHQIRNSSKHPKIKLFFTSSTLTASFSLANKLGLLPEENEMLTNGSLNSEKGGGVEDMQTACQKSVQALVELIHTLHICMSEINKEYVCTIEKQIQLTKLCDDLGPGEHWDELIKCRVQADDLKMEFDKYELLVNKIGQMVFYQAVTSLMSGNEKELDMLNYEFKKLEEVVKDLAKQNRNIEKQLLSQNINSILATAPSK